jgi:RNA polymerase sigma-70 factor (ECF subfamily)
MESQPPKEQPGDAADAASGLSMTRELLPLAKSGDRDARGELLARYQRPLERFLHARLPPSARGLGDTQDLVQEVFARTLDSLSELEFRGAGAFWSYLRTVGARYVVDLSRKRSPAAAAGDELADSRVAPRSLEQSPLAQVVGREQIDAFERALEHLPERSREALLLRLELGLDYASIARELAFPSPDAARMAVTRALGDVAREMSRGGRSD